MSPPTLFVAQRLRGLPPVVASTPSPSLFCCGSFILSLSLLSLLFCNFIVVLRYPTVFCRCFKVLVALSTQTGALYFLHPMDPAKYMSYYETVAEPLAFAQLARRLRVAAAASRGGNAATTAPPVAFEDAVQEFAAGVRHVFLNAAGYNPPLTSPWLAGRKLSAVFERLLLDWVLDPKVGCTVCVCVCVCVCLSVCLSVCVYVRQETRLCFSFLWCTRQWVVSTPSSLAPPVPQ